VVVGDSVGGGGGSNVKDVMMVQPSTIFPIAFHSQNTKVWSLEKSVKVYIHHGC